MDLADLKIIGWSMDNGMGTSSTVVDSWKIEIKNRPLKRELIFIVTEESNMQAMNSSDASKGCRYYKV